MYFYDLKIRLIKFIVEPLFTDFHFFHEKSPKQESF